MPFFGQRQRGIDLRQDYSKAGGEAVAATQREPSMRGLDIPGYEMRSRDTALAAGVEHSLAGHQIRMQEDANIRAWAELALNKDRAGLNRQVAEHGMGLQDRQFGMQMRERGMNWVPGMGTQVQGGGIPQQPVQEDVPRMRNGLPMNPERRKQEINDRAKARLAAARGGSNFVGSGTYQADPNVQQGGIPNRPRDAFSVMQDQRLRSGELANQGAQIANQGGAIANQVTWNEELRNQSRYKTEGNLIDRKAKQEDEARRLTLYGSYTPESAQAYEQTGNPAVLEPRAQPLDKSLVKSVLDNPEKWTEESRDRFMQTGNLADLDYKAASEDIGDSDMPFFSSMAGEMGYNMEGMSEKYSKGSKEGESFSTPKGQAFVSAVKQLKKKYPDATSGQIAAEAARQLGYRNLANPDVGAELDAAIEKATDGKNKPEAKALEKEKEAWEKMQGRLRQSMAGYAPTDIGMQRFGGSEPYEYVGMMMAEKGVTATEAIGILEQAGLIGRVGGSMQGSPRQQNQQGGGLDWGGVAKTALDAGKGALGIPVIPQFGPGSPTYRGGKTY